MTGYSKGTRTKGPVPTASIPTAPGSNPNGSLGVALLRVNLQGRTTSDNTRSVVDSDPMGGINGLIQAFDFETRTLVESVSISFAQGRFFNEDDVLVRAAGLASVNNRYVNFEMLATRIDGVIEFRVVDSQSGVVLAEATGEPDRSTLELEITRL